MRNILKRITALAIAAALLIPAVPAAFAESFSAIVTSDSMQVYGDTQLFEILGSLKKNTVLTVLSYDNGIANISYHGYTGYAQIKDMATVESVSVKGVITNPGYVYASASVKSRHVKAKKGLIVNVLAAKKGWALIEYNGYTGYIKTSCLTQYTEPTASPEPTADINSDVISCNISATVTASNLPVYSTASGTQKLGTLSKGTVITVHAYSSKIAYIEYNGHYGYCAVSGLEKTPEATVAPTATPAPTSSPASSSKKLTTNYEDTNYTNEERIVAFLVNECGFNIAGACGIIAHMKYSSGFKPTALNSSSGAYGICQWTNGRKSALQTYCKNNGYDYTTLTGQLYYLKYELTTKYKGVYNYILGVENTADGAYDAAGYWTYHFAGSNNPALKAVRDGNTAKETYWPKYSKYAN